MPKPLNSWNQFAQEKRQEGLSFERIGALWKGQEGAQWREQRTGDGQVPIPAYDALLWPGLQTLKDAGRPLSLQEHLAAVIRLMDIPPKHQQLMHLETGQTEVQYRLAWARTYLKKAGAIENVGRGLWQCTNFGRALTQDEVMEIPAKVRKEGYSVNLPPVYARILRAVQELESKGTLPSEDARQKHYELFRERFGPDALMALDGEELLASMHDHSDNNSLVYWLEFKNDDEFPAIFGSIAGGSALKFGIYKRKETGKWMKGHPTKQVELSLEEAIGIAKRHREQLLRGVDLLRQLSPDAQADDYAQLDEALLEECPDVAFKAWGHKYFSLMFPDLLDDYHNFKLQQFHLTKLLIEPPQTDGRYKAAHSFLSVAQELGIHVNTLTIALNHLHPFWHRYWRIGTKLGGKQDIWGDMRAGGFIAVGWPAIGNLSGIEPNQKEKTILADKMKHLWPNSPSTPSNQAGQLLDFCHQTEENDLVLASDGHHVRGIARITWAYEYHEDSPFPHRKPVEWLSDEEWDMPSWKGLVPSTIRIIEHKKYAPTLLEVERRLLEDRPVLTPIPSIPHVAAPPKLTGIPERIQSVLERKKQVILYGPPGTGKTYWAMRTAQELAARATFNKGFEELSSDERQSIGGRETQPDQVRTCCFHPEYGYENFIEGYAPSEQGGQVSFHLEDGIFKKLCLDAAKPENIHKNYYLIIDEINRGDIPRIFGELLLLLEADKRELSLTLPVSKQSFRVPENVFVIATMNTADRSIALLDTALRRRFGFVELMPDSRLLGDTVMEGIPLALWLDAINQRIRQRIGQDARNLQIGHAYFMKSGKTVTTIQDFTQILRDDIVPLLEEYCYEDYGQLARILGSTFVDGAWRIRQDLFEAANTDKLVKALLAPNPEIATSDPSIKAEEQRDEDDFIDEEPDSELEGEPENA